MPINKYKLYVFDWDGTLSTSTPLVRFVRIFKRRYSVNYVRSHASSYGRARLDRIVYKEEVNRLYASLYDLYLMFVKPKLQVGALDLLKTLSESGKKVAIFSDSKKYRLLKEIRLLGALDYVDFVLSADAIKRFKPNPDGLLIMARKFRVGKRECVYVGDMASDILTAKFAGFDSCSVGNGVDPYGLLKRIGPDYLFRDLIEFYRAFWSKK
jgi:HAD superfamily hydrolase (TIGR01549 family)